MALSPEIIEKLRGAVGAHGTITAPEELRTYECDGLTAYRAVPGAVVLPANTAEVQSLVRICHESRIPFVARGSGTG
ncbi:MAG: FAD-binding protein, partial [Acidobacteriia bacterium]|nr:FAD-binding protein [Terriglobia bacterium]